MHGVVNALPAKFLFWLKCCLERWLLEWSTTFKAIFKYSIMRLGDYHDIKAYYWYMPSQASTFTGTLFYLQCYLAISAEVGLRL